MTDLTPGSHWLLPASLMAYGWLSIPYYGGSIEFRYDNRELNRIGIPADRITELEAEVKRQIEAVAEWMIKNSYATGHGDTIDDLLSELDWQHAKRDTTNAHN